jgi:CRP/FNR family transcriptional regulator, cyclic AMP receptor protein
MNSASGPALAGHQFTHGMAEDHIAALAGVASHVRLPARHRLFDEGGTADRFWLIQAGQVALDMNVPGRGMVVIETLGMGDVVGWSWLYSPFQWKLGAVTTRPTQAFEVDGRAVREMCAADPGLGFELTRQLLAVVVHRLQVTRTRLLDIAAQAPDWP